MVIGQIPGGQPERLRLMNEDPVAAEEAGLVNLDGHVWTQAELQERWDHGWGVYGTAETWDGYQVFRTLGEDGGERIWRASWASVWWNVYEMRADTRIDVLGDSDIPGVWPMKGGFVACPRLAVGLIGRWAKTSGEDVRIEGYQVFEDINEVWRDDHYGMALPDPNPRGDTGQSVTTYVPGRVDGQRVFVPDGYQGEVKDLAAADEQGWGRDDGLNAWADILDEAGEVSVTLVEGESVVKMWRPSDVIQCFGVGRQPVGYDPPDGLKAAYRNACVQHSGHTMKELDAMEWSAPEPGLRRNYPEM